MPRILLVEDDPAVREIFKTIFEREGMAVDAVGDGESALRRFSSFSSRPRRAGHNAAGHRRHLRLPGDQEDKQRTYRHA